MVRRVPHYIYIYIYIPAYFVTGIHDFSVYATHGRFQCWGLSWAACMIFGMSAAMIVREFVLLVTSRNARRGLRHGRVDSSSIQAGSVADQTELDRRRPSVRRRCSSAPAISRSAQPLILVGRSSQWSNPDPPQTGHEPAGAASRSTEKKPFLRPVVALKSP